MSYLLTHFWPGGTEDQYRATLAAVHPDGALPAGQTHHVAGPTEGGFLVVVLWDSKASADAFVSTTLIPAMPVQGGLVGPPEERTAEVVNAVGV
jgi:hypothetical protein